jgi:predicted unusual protein kinase regulating ubiquinone biosynthesis (AarF/ABC1/UbiB family)
MGISIKPEHLKRYKDIALLLIKYGTSDLVKNAGLEEAIVSEKDRPVIVPGKAEEFVSDLEKLGPVFVKLGQVLSTRPDFLPAAYLEALSRLQDNCAPFSFAEVEKTVVDELGVRLSSLFSEFTEEPLAAASLGQIHRAVMRDGRQVAVKIQRPGIREEVAEDIQVLSDVAAFYESNTETGKRYQLTAMMDEFRKSLMAELDYNKEAHNLETLKTNLAEFELIMVPAPIADYSTSKVLTMQFIAGKKITLVSGLDQLDFDGAPLAEEVFKAYLKQVLLDGFFHADPHPGNVFLTEDKRIALLDLGMVGRLTPVLREKILQLLLAVSDNRPDIVADVCVDIGEPLEKFDEPKFRRQICDLVQNYLGGNIEDMNMGLVMLGLTKSAGNCFIRIPPEVTMLGKMLLNLDQVGRTLDPQFNPSESIKKNAYEIMQRQMLKSVTSGKIYTTMLETKDLLAKLPGSVNKILDLVSTNKLRLKVDSIDEPKLIDAFQKIANRITLGLVLAALIIGASIMMRIPSAFMLLGYPGIAIICFLCAASAGFTLVANILIHDQHPCKTD